MKAYGVNSCYWLLKPTPYATKNFFLLRETFTCTPLQERLANHFAVWRLRDTCSTQATVVHSCLFELALADFWVWSVTTHFTLGFYRPEPL